MANALRKVGKVAGIIAAVASVIPGGQPIAAIAATVAAVSNVGAAILATKPPARGSVNGISIGSDNPTPLLLGRTYYGGTRIYQRGYGETTKKVPNPYLLLVDVYSGAGPVDGLEALWLDKQSLASSGSYFAGYLYTASQIGQVPEPSALAPQWSGAPGWGSNAKLSGKAAIAWSLKFDKDGKVFASGAPQTGAVWRGVRTWDPRGDSTYPGGSGASRRTDAATWGFTRSPGLLALQYALGWYHLGQKVMGCGIPLDGIVVEDFVHLANVCDANGWFCDGVVFEPGDKWTNLKDILAAGGAEPVFVGGRLGVKVSAPRVALDTVTADDLTDDEIVIGTGPGWEDRLNTLVPKYRSEAHQWEYVQTANVVSISSYVATDGEEKKAERQLNLVQSATQASQLCALELLDRRELGDIEITVKPRLRRYGAGSLLIVNLPEEGLVNQPCVLLKRTLDPTSMSVKWVLRGETTGKYAYALALTGTAPPLPALGTTEALDETSLAAEVPTRAAYAVKSQSVAYPLTSNANSITIAAYTGVLDDGTSVSFPAGSITGLAASTPYLVFRSLVTNTYFAAVEPALAEMASSDNIFMDGFATLDGAGVPPAGETPPPGQGSGGGRYGRGPIP